MSEILIVACDGSPASERALEFAAKEANHLNASVVVAHVLEWLPYSFLTAEELEQRHRRRADEMERARQHFLQPLVESHAGSGIEFCVDVSYGGVSESLLNVIKKQKGTQLFLGRKGTNDIS